MCPRGSFPPLLGTESATACGSDTRQILLLGFGFLSERERNSSHICVEWWGKGSIASASSDRDVIPKVSAADLAKEQENMLYSIVQLGSNSTGFFKALG